MHLNMIVNRRTKSLVLAITIHTIRIRMSDKYVRFLFTPTVQRKRCGLFFSIIFLFFNPPDHVSSQRTPHLTLRRSPSHATTMFILRSARMCVRVHNSIMLLLQRVHLTLRYDTSSRNIPSRIRSRRRIFIITIII